MFRNPFDTDMYPLEDLWSQLRFATHQAALRTGITQFLDKMETRPKEMETPRWGTGASPIGAGIRACSFTAPYDLSR